MQGMDAATGGPREGVEHVIQSVRDILSTPIGTRVMRRDYGSDLPALVDAPINAATLIDFSAAAITALRRWEPRLEVRRVRVTDVQPGRVGLAIEAVYRPDGAARSTGPTVPHSPST